MKLLALKLAFLAFLTHSGCQAKVADSELCLGDCSGTGADKVCVFKFELDVFASETGYYRVKGCDGVQPTLGMIQGVKYIFDQSNHTNWFHPLGFAYIPDGVYGQDHTNPDHDFPELEKSVTPRGGTPCNASTPCQHPQYKLNGENLCSSDPCDEEDFGLDEYEGVYFSGKREDWIAAGNFSVEVTITDDVTTEIFYFCHIHNKMSGRIKILNADGTQKNPEDLQVIPYEYQQISEFDQKCGTFNLSSYENGKECPDMTFLCDSELDTFGECLVAMDCAMHVEMRVSGGLDPTVTFMHQMIAHHQNAVNMAKALLKAAPPSLKCGTSYDGRRRLDEEGECHDFATDGNEPVIGLLWDIINTQNAQITFMRAWLKDQKQPAYDFCEHNDGTKAALIGGIIGAVLIVLLSVLTTYCIMKKRNDKAASPVVRNEDSKAGSEFVSQS